MVRKTVAGGGEEKPSKGVRLVLTAAELALAKRAAGIRGVAVAHLARESLLGEVARVIREDDAQRK